MQVANINISGIGFGVAGLLSDPPASPAQGADYAVGPNATGAWAGHEGKVARADANQVTGWLMFDPVLIYVQDVRKLHDLQNGQWTPVPAGGVVTTLGDLDGVELDGDGDTLKKDAEGVWRDEYAPIGGGGGGLPAPSRMVSAGVASIPSSVLTTLAMAQDVGGPFRGNGAPANGFIVPAGVSRVNIDAHANMVNVSNHASVRIVRNGTETVIHDGGGATGYTEYFSPRISGLLVTEGDTFELVAYHTTGSSRNANQAPGAFYFQISAA